MSTRETFTLHRALVVSHREKTIFITVPSVSGPNVEIAASYPYPPPSPGTYVWLAATYSFDKFFVITEPVSMLEALEQQFSSIVLNLATSSRLIGTSGTGLSGGGDLTADLVITLDPLTLASDTAFISTFAPLLLAETTTKTTNYTLALTDQGKVVPMDGASLTLTVPTNSSVAFPTGSVVNVYNLNATDVTIAGESGVTVRNSGNLVQYGEISLRKRGTDEWIVAGNLS